MEQGTKKRGSWIAYVGVLLAMLGAGVPIAWDYYSHQRSLEIRQLSSISILVDDPIRQQVAVYFDTTRVDNLTKCAFVLINTGHSPITDMDVKDSPSLRFASGTQVIDARVTRTDPPEVHAKVRLDSLTQSINVDFILLNPSDFVEFDVYVAGDSASVISVGSRIVGVRRVSFSDMRASGVATAARPSWALIPVSVVLVLVLMLLVAIDYEIRAQRNLKEKLEGDRSLLRKLSTPPQLEEFVDRDLTYVTTSEKAKLKEAIRDLSGDQNVISKIIRRAVIEAQMQVHIEDTGTLVGMRRFFVVIALFAGTYVAYQFWKWF